MGIIVEITHHSDDDEKRKSQKEKAFIKTGQEFNITDSTINCISIPAKCNNCGTSNMLFASDIEMSVEVHERAMGKETYHHAEGFAKCKKCDSNMVVSINLVEYPEGAGAITFIDELIEEVENCTYEKDADLSKFLKK